MFQTPTHVLPIGVSAKCEQRNFWALSFDLATAQAHTTECLLCVTTLTEPILWGSVTWLKQIIQLIVSSFKPADGTLCLPKKIVLHMCLVSADQGSILGAEYRHHTIERSRFESALPAMGLPMCLLFLPLMSLAAIPIFHMSSKQQLHAVPVTIRFSRVLTRLCMVQSIRESCHCQPACPPASAQQAAQASGIGR